MAELGHIFRAGSAGAAEHHRKVRDDAELERLLVELHARGRRLYPGLALDQATFVAYLARCGADLGAAADDARAGDLFLAAAAMTGEPAAVLELTRNCWRVALRYLRRLGMSSAELEDVAQELWKSLLVGADGGSPKLTSYSGRGPLGAFVGITAQRIALMRFRRADAATRALRAAAEVAALTFDPEMAMVKQRYRRHFQEAIGEVLQGLDDRTRMVLRMHVIDRVSLERIAQAYRVRQSSVSRWIEKARRHVALETHRALRKRLQLSRSDFDSIRRLVVSQLDLSIAGFLSSPDLPERSQADQHPLAPSKRPPAEPRARTRARANSRVGGSGARR